MIMDADSNVDKSTLPLQDALKIYDKMGEHWLIREIHDVFEEDSCGTNRNIDNKIYRVPNEEFLTGETEVNHLFQGNFKQETWR